jgi:hypothetical protein
MGLDNIQGFSHVPTVLNTNGTCGFIAARYDLPVLDARSSKTYDKLEAATYDDHPYGCKDYTLACF